MKKFLIFVASVYMLCLIMMYGLFILDRYHNNNNKNIKQPITKEETIKIYNELTKYTGLPRDMLPELLVVKDDKIINAYYDPSANTITIYTGLLNFTENKDEVAGVLGHELAHFILQSTVLRDIQGDNLSNDYSSFLEGNADKFGVYLIYRAGYNPCKIQNFWRRLRDIGGDIEISSTHPNYSYRVWQLDFPACNA